MVRKTFIKPMSSLPHRFSEKAFRKYEKIIEQIAEKFPQPVTITPSKMGLSPETVRGRLRDAITSGINNRWPSSVNYGNLLHADVSGLVISLRPDGSVIAGTKDTIKQSNPLSLDSMVESDEIFDATHLSPVNITQIECLCWLAAEKQLKNKVKLAIDDIYAADLQSRYDIVLEPKPEQEAYLLS